MNIPFTPELPSFDALFDTIANSVQKEKLVIVIDELPFLTSSYHGFISYLQGFCDGTKRENKNIKLLLSGSNMSFMMDLLSNKTKPLYQRATFKLFVKPMLFSDAVKTLSGLTNVDKAKCLSVFGNRPYYLEKLAKEKVLKRISPLFALTSLLFLLMRLT